MLGNPAVSVIVDAYEKGIRNYDVRQAFRFCQSTVDRFGNVCVCGAMQRGRKG